MLPNLKNCFDMLHIHSDVCSHHLSGDQVEQMNHPNKNNRKISQDNQYMSEQEARIRSEHYKRS